MELISALLAITMGIIIVVRIKITSVVSEKTVAINLNNLELGENISVLPQGASINNYYSAAKRLYLKENQRINIEKKSFYVF